MAIYAVIKSLLMPPGILILLLLAAFFLVRGVLGRLLIFITLTLLTLMSLSAISIRLIEPLEAYPALGAESRPIPSSAQAIVIMGAGRARQAPEYGGDTLDDASLRRVRYGARLYRATGLPVYVTGGRLESESEPIAQLMADVLMDDYGVPGAVQETASRTSWENAAFTARLLARDGVSHILLVSDAWHLPRSVDVFEETGLTVTPAPTAFKHYRGWETDLTYRDWLPSTPAFLISYYAIHEHFGRVWYQIRKWVEGAPRAPEPRPSGGPNGAD